MPAIGKVAATMIEAEHTVSTVGMVM